MKLHGARCGSALGSDGGRSGRRERRRRREEGGSGLWLGEERRGRSAWGDKDAGEGRRGLSHATRRSAHADGVREMAACSPRWEKGRGKKGSRGLTVGLRREEEKKKKNGGAGWLGQKEEKMGRPGLERRETGRSRKGKGPRQKREFLLLIKNKSRKQKR